ncbi:hypothetical protein KEM48_002184 [Puccinia striiformis f. sp. tritici PST-130]|nr:hypothetical protein KEM48_002184 [Puccinia striiformis f. sp. tritici PST-130]
MIRSTDLQQSNNDRANFQVYLVTNQIWDISLRSMPMDDSMESPPDSPTLFGIRHDPKKNPTQAFSVPPVDPARPNNRTSTPQPFVPMRPEEMDTFFGGNLLESECFEPSPLQGKRMRYTDPKDPKDPKGP